MSSNYYNRYRGGPFVSGWAGGYRRLPYYDQTLNQNYYGDLYYRLGAYDNGPFDMKPPNQNLNCYLYGGCCNRGRCGNNAFYDPYYPPY